MLGCRATVVYYSRRYSGITERRTIERNLADVWITLLVEICVDVSLRVVVDVSPNIEFPGRAGLALFVTTATPCIWRVLWSVLWLVIDMVRGSLGEQLIETQEIEYQTSPPQ